MRGIGNKLGGWFLDSFSCGIDVNAVTASQHNAKSSERNELLFMLARTQGMAL